MTADIVDFPAKTTRSPGNGAREALTAHAEEEFADTSPEDAARWADFTLASLWARGFKVVPLDGSEDAG